MKKSIAKKKDAKYPHDITVKEFLEFHQHNLYCRPQEETLVERPFWSKSQSLNYVVVLKHKTNLYVDVKSIDIGYMGSRPHTEYFAEARAHCLQRGQFPINSFNKDFGNKIVAEFYATVHFHQDEERHLTWMAGIRLLRSNWKTFMNSLGYADRGLDEPIGHRPHTVVAAVHKSKIIRYSTVVQAGKGSRIYLIPFLDIMHYIFCNTLFPRVANKD
ncbi:hypothetical protein D1007_25123 [Hordeum vulgare]|nr:hypothetical protein D1007_25123 [Hordeum vulgare]